MEVPLRDNEGRCRHAPTWTPAALGPAQQQHRLHSRSRGPVRVHSSRHRPRMPSATPPSRTLRTAPSGPRRPAPDALLILHALLELSTRRARGCRPTSEVRARDHRPDAAVHLSRTRTGTAPRTELERRMLRIEQLENPTGDHRGRRRTGYPGWGTADTARWCLPPTALPPVEPQTVGSGVVTG